MRFGASESKGLRDTHLLSPQDKEIEQTRVKTIL